MVNGEYMLESVKGVEAVLPANGIICGYVQSISCIVQCTESSF